MAAQGSLRLVDTVKQIQLKVNIEIAKEANRKAAKIKTSILPKIRQVISTALASSDTIRPTVQQLRRPIGLQHLLARYDLHAPPRAQ